MDSLAASNILLNDPHLRGSEDSISNFPSCLHHITHGVHFDLLAFGHSGWHDENGIVDIGVELLVNWVELLHIELLKYLIHNSSCHLLSLDDALELFLEEIKVFALFNLLHVDMLQGEREVVSDIEEFLGEFANSELFLVFDEPSVPLDCVVILRHLVDQLFLELLL